MHNSIGIISREMFCLELPSQAHLFPLFSCFSKFYNDEHCNIIHYLQDCLLTLFKYTYTKSHRANYKHFFQYLQYWPRLFKGWITVSTG